MQTFKIFKTRLIFPSNRWLSCKSQINNDEKSTQNHIYDAKYHFINTQVVKLAKKSASKSNTTLNFELIKSLKFFQIFTKLILFQIFYRVAQKHDHFLFTKILLFLLCATILFNILLIFWIKSDPCFLGHFVHFFLKFLKFLKTLKLLKALNFLKFTEFFLKPLKTSNFFKKF